MSGYLNMLCMVQQRFTFIGILWQFPLPFSCFLFMQRNCFSPDKWKLMRNMRFFDFLITWHTQKFTVIPCKLSVQCTLPLRMLVQGICCLTGYLQIAHSLSFLCCDSSATFSFVRLSLIGAELARSRVLSICKWKCQSFNLKLSQSQDTHTPA